MCMNFVCYFFVMFQKYFPFKFQSIMIIIFGNWIWCVLCLFELESKEVWKFLNVHCISWVFFEMRLQNFWLVDVSFFNCLLLLLLFNELWMKRCQLTRRLKSFVPCSRKTIDWISPSIGVSLFFMRLIKYYRQYCTIDLWHLQKKFWVITNNPQAW